MSVDPMKKRLQLTLVIAVSLWGIYLAIGAVRGPRDFGNYEMDYRKGAIVLTITSLFVACWLFVCVRARHALGSRQGDSSQTAVADSHRWNFASACGFLLAGATVGSMAMAAWGGWQASGWAFLIVFAMALASGTASLVGLSNPRRADGRWLGMVGLGLLVLSFVIGFYV